jgi:solute carrier family 25 carnitine/acylcarnitine transporter 20/29
MPVHSVARYTSDGSYEASCRFFKWRRSLPSTSHGHGLIDEAEAELHSGLNWAELMAAGGVAGVIAWVVSNGT